MRCKSNEPNYVLLSKERLDALLAEKKRTNLGSIALLKNASDVPDGLKASTIDRWLAGQKAVRKSHYRYVIQRYKSLPDNCANVRRPIRDAPGRIQVTAELRKKLRTLHGQAPLKYLDNAPCGFNDVKLAHVLSGRNKTIPSEFVDYLTALVDLRADGIEATNELCKPDLNVQDLPSNPPPRRKLAKFNLNKFPGAEYIVITDSIYRQLHLERRRTLVSHNRLLKFRDDVPQGLRAYTVQQWMLGSTQSAERRYLDYVLAAYAALPDALGLPSDHSSK